MLSTTGKTRTNAKACPNLRLQLPTKSTSACTLAHTLGETLAYTLARTLPCTLAHTLANTLARTMTGPHPSLKAGSFSRLMITSFQGREPLSIARILSWLA